MMGWVRALLARYVDDLTFRVGSVIRRAVARAVISIVAGLSFLIAAGYLVAALHGTLSRHFGPLIADLSLAGLFVLAGLILLLVARAIGNRPPAVRAAAYAPAPVPPPPRRAAAARRPAPPPRPEPPPDTPYPAFDAEPDERSGAPQGVARRIVTAPLVAGAFVAGFVGALFRRRR